jgi:hypothetical protein
LNKTGIKRVIPIEEVKSKDYYSDIGELAEIFNHDVVEMDNDVWRFKPNSLVGWLDDNCPVYTPPGEYRGANSKSIRGGLDLNVLWCDFHEDKFTLEELVKFYMGMGYSLCGFCDVFGQHEAEEWGLEGAKKSEKADDHYTQTPIDWLIEKHKGKVLKI